MRALILQIRTWQIPLLLWGAGLVPPTAAETLRAPNELVPPAAPLPDLGEALIRVAVALAIVLTLFAFGVWLFRNWQRMVGPRPGPKLRVLEVRPLGGRQTLYVVAYEQERLLLAASPQGVSLLTHLPPDGDACSSEARLGAKSAHRHSGIFSAIWGRAQSWRL
ncbi:MAG: flagellar biosynthetic protein FliO [Verrucomicrobiota bacterium]|nr:flagellar biosynthetic protein FliO [Limisphaera sp.]MDW8381033.1 flagellar biosynthetic protein FliO [Verrucomicrobiota bacterium]